MMVGMPGPSAPDRPPTVEIEITGVAAGGEGVGRLPDGRAVFVRGALPGERVAALVAEERKRFARALLVEVVEASADRRTPPCPLVEAGCGGCGWQHVDPAAQRRLKADVVTDALRRLGRLEPPEITHGADLPREAWRTTVRAGVDPGGRPGFRLHHTHDLVSLTEAGCFVAHPLVDEVLRTGVFPKPAQEVTVRASVATGARLAVVTPVARQCEVPDGVVVVGGRELEGGHRAWIHEEAAGRRWRVSALSFFQPSPEAAGALVEAVTGVLGADLAPGVTLVDLYGGVGLFAGALGSATGGRVIVVEANRSAVADARVNLADLPDARVVTKDVRRWRPSTAEVVVADPSRHGLGAEAVSRIGETGAGTLALVSCDAGALGRDAGLLAAAGWRLDSAVLVDLFPHTPHVEVVTGWRRAP